MCTLDTFPNPPDENHITFCEWENKLITFPQGERNTCQYLEIIANYPKIEIPGDILKPQGSKDSARAAFIHHSSSVRSRIASTWQEYGLLGTLEELACNRDEENGECWMQLLAQWSLALLRRPTALYQSFFPHTTWSKEEMIREFSPIAHWDQGVIHAFAWHPGTTKFAIALCDDSIRIYSLKNTIVPTLKHKLQKQVSDMAWKPFSASVLAVACETCILIWHIEPSSLITRPSANCVQVLQHSNHQPVNSLSWDPNGMLLLSVSVRSTSMMIWNTALEECVPLRRLGGGGVSFVKWSPDASLVFAAALSPLFRVWESQSWSCEMWKNLNGRCQTACWSPDGSILLFAIKNEPVIFSLNFQQNFDASSQNSKVGGSKAAVPVINLTEVTFESPNGPINIGGNVHSLEWDPTGERLAIIFANKVADKFQRYIAVFRTQIKPVLEITPCGFLCGGSQEIPQLMRFQKNYTGGALLAVCWTNFMTGAGRIAFIPFHFTSLSQSDETPIVVRSHSTILPRNYLFTSEPTLKLH